MLQITEYGSVFNYILLWVDARIYNTNQDTVVK